jgi:hypothetical protein
MLAAGGEELLEGGRNGPARRISAHMYRRQISALEAAFAFVDRLDAQRELASASTGARREARVRA